MKKKSGIRALRKTVSILLALAFMISGAMSVMADSYDIGTGSISVREEDGTNYITQENNADATDKADNNIVISGYTDGNTITIDGGATITLDGAEINGYPESNSNTTPITVTDESGSGKTATIYMNDSELIGGWIRSDDTTTDNTPAILIEEGASLELVVTGENYIEGGADYTNNGYTTPGIQLNDGATLTITDGEGGGELEVCGGYSGFGEKDEDTKGSAGIGSANNTDADIVINIIENESLELTVESGDGTSSGAAIGSGAGSGGSVTININGGYIYAKSFSENKDDKAIGAGAGSNAEITLNIEGKPVIFSSNIDNENQIVTLYTEDGGVRIYDIDDYDATSQRASEISEDLAVDAFVEMMQKVLALFIEYGIYDAEGNQIVSDEEIDRMMEEDPVFADKYQKILIDYANYIDAITKEAMATALEETATLLYAYDSPEDSPLLKDYISADEFAVRFAIDLGRELPEIAELAGSSRRETFNNYKEYVEKNKLFDTEYLMPGTKLTAGQIAVSLCTAAGVKLSGSDKETEALEKLAEKNIMASYSKNNLVPTDAAKYAIAQVIAEFIAK